MKIFKMIGAILICQMAGIIGSIFTIPAVSGWYRHLDKPFFTPPGWIFGPVWTFLYLLMGISLYLIWEKSAENTSAKKALIPFFIQLILNIMWSFIFFGMHRLDMAFTEILILLAMIFVTISVFHRFSPSASYLLIPYALWTSFASVLSYHIWRMNM